MESRSLITEFKEKFGRSPIWESRAPGRVNILGEHTDYNDGFVFPAAIDRYLTVLVAPRRDRRVQVYSVDFRESDEFTMEKIESSSECSWSNYLRGVLAEYQKRGLQPKGMDVVLHGNVPVGAGLSSSAAYEVAVGAVVQKLNDWKLDPQELALLAQAAEREFVGVQCGIMDQFVSVLAEEGTALFLDCRDLSFERVPLAASTSLVVCDSKVQRSLGASAYNERREQCEKSVAILSQVLPGISALRDVSPSQLEEHKALLNPTTYRRARHVVTENDRVKRGVELLKKGDLSSFAEILYASHESLRDDYEVSCPELDVLVEQARRAPGIVGGRMTGAGFGGCTVNLVDSARTEEFCAVVEREYLRSVGHECEAYVCEPSAGVRSRRVEGGGRNAGS